MPRFAATLLFVAALALGAALARPALAEGPARLSLVPPPVTAPQPLLTRPAKVMSLLLILEGLRQAQLPSGAPKV